MKFVPAWSYDNYVAAHIAMGRLEKEGFICWLKDEYTVTIDPILTNAVGGIKLMVEEAVAQQALALLKQLQLEHKASLTCPYCGSHNIEEISSPRKASNWASALIGFFITSYAIPVEKVLHCFDCGKEFEEAINGNKA